MLHNVIAFNIIRKRGVIYTGIPHQQEIIDKVHRLLKVARELYDAFDLQPMHVPVVFANMGTTAGYAKRRKTEYDEWIFNVEINVQAITIDWEDTFSDTIPHEVAHIVTRYLHGSKVKTHGPEWKRIAIALGSTGKRTHSMPLKNVRRRSRVPQRLYVYEGMNGMQMKLSIIRHNKLQSGKALWYRTSSVGKVYAGDYIGQAF
jgi:predicted SprT family Zn-dependent metalloprotease